MPVTLQSTNATGSPASSLRSEPFLSPPSSHNASEDTPFKSDDNDHVSLSMKKHRGHRQRRRHASPSRTICKRESLGRKKSRKSGRDRPACDLRQTHSLPSIQPHFDSGTVELLAYPKHRNRRWTVPSKASPARGLATIVSIEDAARRVGRPSAIEFDSNQSPAMITLRRATTSRSQSQRRMSLTSFPTPKFSRGNSGFLSAFLNTITGHDEPLAQKKTSLQPTRQPFQNSTVRSDEVSPTTSAVAPPVQTEVRMVERRGSSPGPNPAIAPIRRYSTRYVSDDVVYEIIWDENWSSTSSEGAAPSPPYGGLLSDTRPSIGMETLERRLSNALSQSRRTSLQGGTHRRPSFVSGGKTFLRGQMVNSKLARLVREPAFGNLPFSKTSRKTDILTPMTAQIDSKQHMLIAAQPTEVGTGRVEFFPPPNSRANSNASTKPQDSLSDSPNRSSGRGETSDRVVFGAHWEELDLGMGRRHYGSKVGISAHAKRMSVCSGLPEQDHELRCIRPDVGEGGQCGRRGQVSNDERIPLLRPDYLPE